MCAPTLRVSFTSMDSTSNAPKALSPREYVCHWHLLLCGSSLIIQSEFMKADTLETIMAADSTGFPERFGAEFYFMHRVDLHTELRRLAEEADGITTPVKINLSSEVVDVHVDTAELTLRDGSQIKKDLVVAADGIHVRAEAIQHAQYSYA